MFVIQKNEASSKTIRMPNALIEQLEEIAASEDISFNQLVIQCCEYALANLPKNDGKITCTEQFISRKKQIKAAFQEHMTKHSTANEQTISQIFTDAIYPTQRRNANLGVDLYGILVGDMSIDEYRGVLEKYFVSMNSPNATSRANGYANCTKQLKEFMEQANLICPPLSVLTKYDCFL